MLLAILGKEFKKEDKEIRRQIRSGRNHFFCSLSCSHCSEELDRNINAAINIKNEGCRMLGID